MTTSRRVYCFFSVGHLLKNSKMMKLRVLTNEVKKKLCTMKTWMGMISNTPQKSQRGRPNGIAKRNTMICMVIPTSMMRMPPRLTTLALFDVHPTQYRQKGSIGSTGENQNQKKLFHNITSKLFWLKTDFFRIKNTC